jgi:serine/threonine protein phosphatase 1
VNIDTKDQCFLSLGAPNRIWAISAVHAELDKLTNIHDQLFDQISPGDRIVYLGNYIGYGDWPSETIDHIATWSKS